MGVVAGLDSVKDAWAKIRLPQSSDEFKPFNEVLRSLSPIAAIAGQSRHKPASRAAVDRLPSDKRQEATLGPCGWPDGQFGNRLVGETRFVNTAECNGGTSSAPQGGGNRRADHVGGACGRIQRTS